MRLPQATTTPTPQAPAAPTAPTTVGGPPPTPEQVRQQTREQVQKALDDARAQARRARLDAQRAKQEAPSAPVLAPGGGESTTQLPWETPDGRAMIRDLTSYALFTVATVVILLPFAIAIARRIFGRPPVPPALPREIPDQLRRIEQSVESMAIEIERISESQRFLTKLGAGKAEGASLPPRAGA